MRELEILVLQRSFTDRYRRPSLRHSTKSIFRQMRMRSVNTRHKHCLHKLIANLTCFQKAHIMLWSEFSVTYHLISNVMNEKALFKVALKRYWNTHSFYSVHEYLLSRKQLMYLNSLVCSHCVFLGSLVWGLKWYVFCVFLYFCDILWSFWLALDPCNAMQWNGL
jgi:hypothetical protein